MAFWALITIAVALAMDAFAVAISTGIALQTVSARQTFRLSFHFGLFQALMPILGWFAGQSFADWMAPVDHWVAFTLLSVIGGKMIWDAFVPHSDIEDTKARDPTLGASLVILSVATSVDALAVGLSLSLLRVDVWYPALVIGIVAATFTIIGLRLGQRLGQKIGRRASLLGGLLLVGIGVKIVVDHLSA